LTYREEWATPLFSHAQHLFDGFFHNPTATFRVLFTLVTISHDRRKVVHFIVTTNPSAKWTAQQVMGFANLNDFQSAHKKWIEASLSAGGSERQGDWSQSIAVGSQSFIEKVKKNLGFKAKGKSITGSKEHYQLRENVTKFGNSPSGGLYTVEGPDSEFTNTPLWDEKS
jgi:hypothetical protein